MKKYSAILMLLFSVISLTSCAGMGSEHPASSGGAASGQAVSSQTEKEQTVEDTAANDEDSENGDRIDRTVELTIDVDKQIAAIVGKKDEWNMGKHTDESLEESYYVSDFSYAVTDLDQDGLLEILVYSRQGTGHFTDYAVYEVDKTGKDLVEWDIIKDDLVEEECVTPDFYDYPTETYIDKNTDNYHYSLLDHMAGSAVQGTDYLVDMEIVDNTIREHMITYATYEPDGEFESDDDLKMKTECFDSKGKKISEKESEATVRSYYQGMTKRYMFYTPYDVKSKKLEKAGKEYIEQLTWNVEYSWYAFAIEETRRDKEFEKSLSDDIRKQLKTIARKRNGLEQYSDEKWFFVEYAVTDFDQDGRLELTTATIQGSGRYCYYNMYEVDASGKKLVEWKYNMQEGESPADICNTDNATTYTDESSGVIYYHFTDFLRITSEEVYRLSRNVFVKDNVVNETGKLSKKKRKKMKKGAQVFGWRNGDGYQIYRMNSEFMYDELVESWKVFCGE